MPLFLLSFLRGITLKQVMILLGAVAIAVAVWMGVGFVNDKVEAELEVARLERQVETQKESMRILSEVAAQKARAILAADAARAELESLREDYDTLVRDADTAKDEEDGEVAPVLRRTLDALGRLQ